ncbi:UNVERIFIED_CONTAM: hypothetical protein K2H54_004621 [Gekko kuhli]
MINSPARSQASQSDLRMAISPLHLPDRKADIRHHLEHLPKNQTLTQWRLQSANNFRLLLSQNDTLSRPCAQKSLAGNIMMHITTRMLTGTLPTGKVPPSGRILEHRVLL